MRIVALKKKVLEKYQRIYPNCTYKDLFLSFTIKYSGDYNNPDFKEMGRYIASSVDDVFEYFFEPKLEHGEILIIDKDTYNKMIDWLEENLKSMTLYDWAFDEAYYYTYPMDMIEVYRNMIKEREIIDSETEFIIYSNKW